MLLFRHRSSALALCAAPIVWSALARPAPGAGEVALGAGAALLGGALRLAAIRRLGKHARVGAARAAALVTAGPYARLRNPLYAAALLAVLGLGLCAGLGAWALAPAAAAWLIYDLVARHEERVLVAERGGEAAEYVRQVPRWLPRPWRRAAPRADAALVPWAEVLGREWRLAVGLPAGVGAAAALALAPLGDGLRAGALATSEALGAPIAAVVLVVVLLGAGGDVVLTARRVARHTARRAALAAGEAPGGALAARREVEAGSSA